MIFGLLKDRKNGEYRTIATPTEILTIAGAGHTALVQSGAGEKAGFEDEAPPAPRSSKRPKRYTGSAIW